MSHVKLCVPPDTLLIEANQVGEAFIFLVGLYSIIQNATLRLAAGLKSQPMSGVDAEVKVLCCVASLLVSGKQNKLV